MSLVSTFYQDVHDKLQSSLNYNQIAIFQFQYDNFICMFSWLAQWDKIENFVHFQK